MAARVVSRRVAGTALVVLFWSSASGSLAGEAIAGELGPIRQSVAQRNDLRAQVRSSVPLRIPFAGRNHVEQGAIVGAVIGGVMGGLTFGAAGAVACEEHSDGCAEVLLWGAAGAAGGALAGGVVGGLIGSLFQTAPSTPDLPSSSPAKVAILPRRGGVGIALSGSF